LEKVLFILYLLLNGFHVEAQMERTMHQVLELDSVQTIALEIAGDYEIIHWAGNSLLVETRIQIFNANPQILDYLVEQGRYAVLIDTLPDYRLFLRSKETNRKVIKTRLGTCTEFSAVRFFVPDNFYWTDDRKSILRKW
jgi:membrane protease subunit (stomatin/prohibitin family)